MKQVQLVTVCAFIFVITFSSGCQKEFLCDFCRGNSNGGGPVNQPPVAKAGNDINLQLPLDSTMLIGDSSFDTDGNITSYNWQKIQGPANGSIAESSSSSTMVSGLTGGVYKFELTVTDNGGLSAKDTLSIFVSDTAVNYAPVACAGNNFGIALPNNSVTLDGRCTFDPDNNITTYAWTKVSGPTSFNIISPSTPQTRIDNLVAGVYLFELRVTDMQMNSSSDTARVEVSSPPPVCSQYPAMAPMPQLVRVGALSQTRILYSVIAAGNKIFFAGGQYNTQLSDRVDIYDISNNSWSTASLSVARMGIAVAAAGNKVFFAGGSRSHNGTMPVTNVDIYDLTTGTWSLDHLSLAGTDIAGASVGNKAMFIGGSGNNNGRERRIDIYESGSWSTTTLTNVYPAGHSASTLNNKVYIAGGFLPNNDQRALEIYDNTTGNISTSTMLSSKGSFANVAVGNKIYWGGGYDGAWNICELEVWDAALGTSTISNIGYEVSYLTNLGNNAVLANNKILFPNSNYFTLYDIVTGTWQSGNLPPALNESYVSVNNVVYTSSSLSDGNPAQVWRIVF